MSATVDTTQITVNIPTKLLKELQTQVPDWQETQFLVELIERELRRSRLKQVLRESAGAWKAEDHPELAEPDGVEKYVRRIRETWQPRSWDEMIAEDSDE